MPRRTKHHRSTRHVRMLWWLAVLALGLIGLVGVGVAVNRHHDTRPVAHPTPIRPGTATRLAAPSTTAPPASPSVPSSSPSTAKTSVPTPHPVSAPQQISIAAAGISAPVVPVGVSDDGEVAIPEDVRTVGWYKYSPALPSTAGSTVLVGHVDSAAQGEGAFFTLHELRAGDIIRIDRSHGSDLAFRVVSLEEFPKTNVPLSALFSTTGAPRLTLITCGGSFDSSARSYLDNIVVTAVPA